MHDAKSQFIGTIFVAIREQEVARKTKIEPSVSIFKNVAVCSITQNISKLRINSKSKLDSNIVKYLKIMLTIRNI